MVRRSSHDSDYVDPARLPNPLTNACYIQKHHQRRLALSLFFFGIATWSFSVFKFVCSFVMLFIETLYQSFLDLDGVVSGEISSVGIPVRVRGVAVYSS